MNDDNNDSNNRMYIYTTWDMYGELLLNIELITFSYMLKRALHTRLITTATYVGAETSKHFKAR